MAYWCFPVNTHLYSLFFCILVCVFRCLHPGKVQACYPGHMPIDGLPVLPTPTHLYSLFCSMCISVFTSREGSSMLFWAHANRWLTGVAHTHIYIAVVYLYVYFGVYIQGRFKHAVLGTPSLSRKHLSR